MQHKITLVNSPSNNDRPQQRERAGTMSATDIPDIPISRTPPLQIRDLSGRSSVGSKSITFSEASLPELSPSRENSIHEEEDPSCCVDLNKRRQAQAEKCRPYLAVASMALGVVLGMADIVTDCLVIQDWIATNRLAYATALALFILAANLTNTLLLVKHGWNYASLLGVIGMASSLESIALLKRFGLAIHSVDQEHLAHFHLYRLVEASVESFPSAGIQLFLLIVSHESSELHVVSTTISIVSLAIGLVRGVSNGPDHVSHTFDPLFQSLYNNFLLILVVAGDFMLRVCSTTFFLMIVPWRPYVFLALPLIFLFETLLHGIRLTVFDPDVLLGVHLTRRLVTVPAIFIFALLACFSGAPECLVVVDPRQDGKLRRLFWGGLFGRDVLSLIFIFCFMYFGPFNWLAENASDTIWFSILLVCAFVKWAVLLLLRHWQLRGHFSDLEKFRVDTMRQISPTHTIVTEIR